MIRYTDNASFQRRLGHAGNTRSSVSLIYRGLSFVYRGFHDSKTAEIMLKRAKKLGAKKKKKPLGN